VFKAGVGAHHVSAEIVNKIHSDRFEALPKQ
jgi:hypothetical protein